MKLLGLLLIGLTAAIIAVDGQGISTTKLPKEIKVTVTSVHDLTKKTDKPLIVTDKKVLCYVWNFAQHRTGDAKFSPDMIDAEYCTHVLYAFATISENDELVETDPNDVLPNGGYEQVNKLKDKYPNLKTLIVLGGPQVELSKVTDMMKNETSRLQFINSSVAFMQKHKFDGFSFDLFNNASVEIPRDIKDDLNAFLKDFSTESKDETKRTGKPEPLLALSIPAEEGTIEELDLKTIAEHCDWINFLTYGMLNNSLQVTQLNSALFAGNKTNEKNTVDWIVELVLSKDVPKEDVIIGMPTFGYCYELKDPQNNGLGAPVVGLCPGEFTVVPGLLTYFQICPMLNDSSTNDVFLDEEKVNFVSNGTQWVTYDGEKAMKEKVDYLKKEGLAGYSVWTDSDDFKGTSCNKGPYPLVRALYDALMGSVTGKIRGGVTGSLPPLTKILEGSTTFVHKMETTTIKK